MINLFKRVQPISNYRKIVTGGPNAIWEMDLVDMSKVGGSQKGYILVAIDQHTRYAWGKVIKQKSEAEITKALKEIFEEAKPKKILSDKESGFIHNKFLKELGIEVFHLENNPVGAPMVERLIYSLREIMNPLREEQKVKHNWKHLVPKVMEIYNNRIHSAIKATPFDGRC